MIPKRRGGGGKGRRGKRKGGLGGLDQKMDKSGEQLKVLERKGQLSWPKGGAGGGVQPTWLDWGKFRTGKKKRKGGRGHNKPKKKLKRSAFRKSGEREGIGSIQEPQNTEKKHREKKDN